MTVPLRFLLPALLLGASPAMASGQQPDPKSNPKSGPAISVGNAWIATIPNNGPTYGYFRIVNRSEKPILITGYSSPSCSSLKLEEAHSGGINGRAPVQITVAPKTAMVFSRGGYHLVCDRGGHDLAVGQTVPVKMTVDGGADLNVDFTVRTFPQH